MNPETIIQIETLMQLMQQYRIDSLKLEGIELTKTRHDSPAQPTEPQSDEYSEADLFYSVTS